MHAGLSLLARWQGRVKDERDLQQRRMASILCRQTDVRACATRSRSPLPRLWHAVIMRRSTWHTEPTSIVSTGGNYLECLDREVTGVSEGELTGPLRETRIMTGPATYGNCRTSSSGP